MTLTFTCFHLQRVSAHVSIYVVIHWACVLFAAIKPAVKNQCVCVCVRAAVFTVSVSILPPALHRPIGQDLQVVAAVHAVQPGQPPVVPRSRLHSPGILQCEQFSIRHLAHRTHTQDRHTEDTQRSSRQSVPLQWSAVYMLVHEKRDIRGRLEARPRLLASPSSGPPIHHVPPLVFTVIQSILICDTFCV